MARRACTRWGGEALPPPDLPFLPYYYHHHHCIFLTQVLPINDLRKQHPHPTHTERDVAGVRFGPPRPIFHSWHSTTATTAFSSPHRLYKRSAPTPSVPYHYRPRRTRLLAWQGQTLAPPELPILTLGPGLVLGSQWTIHLWPPSSSSGLTAISGPEADLILTHHLRLEKCNVLGDDEITGMWYKLKRQPLCSGRGTSRGMLVSVELRDPRGGSPFSISNNLC